MYIYYMWPPFSSSRLAALGGLPELHSMGRATADSDTDEWIDDYEAWNGLG